MLSLSEDKDGEQCESSLRLRLKRHKHKLALTVFVLATCVQQKLFRNTALTYRKLLKGYDEFVSKQLPVCMSDSYRVTIAFILSYVSVHLVNKSPIFTLY